MKTNDTAAGLLSLVLGCVVIGCAAQNAGFSGPEPRVITVKNAGKYNLDYVELRPADPKAESIRMGRIAPLLRGQEMLFPRPEDAPRLPKTVLIVWSIGGKVFNHEVALSNLPGADNPSDNLTLSIAFTAASDSPVVTIGVPP